MQNEEKGFATKAIHFGYDPAPHEGALTPPLHLTSTFSFESAQAGGEIFAGEREGYFYSRISNPTLDLLERRMAVLERGEAAVSFGSGMGAITAVLWSFLSPGDEVLVDKTLYGCTFAFMNHGLTKFGVTVTHVDMTDPDNLARAMTSKTRIVYFETPANPNMRLVDIAAISKIAHAHEAKVVVDNTYSTPVITQPLSLGADVVVHSATKYLGGHGDLVAGIAVGSAQDMQQVRLVGLKDMTGAVLSPFNAFLILRGVKTLELRMERHTSSAQKVARMLEANAAVESVYYPGLENFDQYELAKKQMRAFGGMIAFELKGGLEAGVRFLDALTLARCAVSLGDAETLVQHPASMTHSTYTPQEREVHGISDGLIRLSVGLETLDDIMQDIENACRVAAI